MQRWDRFLYDILWCFLIWLDNFREIVACGGISNTHSSPSIHLLRFQITLSPPSTYQKVHWLQHCHVVVFESQFTTANFHRPINITETSTFRVTDYDYTKYCIRISCYRVLTIYIIITRQYRRARSQVQWTLMRH